MPEREQVPKDKVNVRLLLVDGKTQDFPFAPTASGLEMAEHVFHHWPEGWAEGETQRPDRAEVIRFIYRGRFLHSSTTLQHLSLPVGKTSILHMVIREKLPDQGQSGQSNSRAKAAQQEHSRCCVIL